MANSNIQCTLDVESSTSYDSDTSLDDSSFETQNNNSIEELVDEIEDKDDKNIQDVSSCIIETQTAVVMPSPSTRKVKGGDDLEPRKVKGGDDLQELAISIKNGAGSTLSKSDLAWASKQSRLKPSYSASLDRNEVRFFDTIEEFGCAKLKRLLELVDDGLEINRLFYIKLRGQKSSAKFVVLNDCLTLCAIKWRSTKGARKGLILESTSFEQMMKELFRTFNDKGLQ